MSQERPPGSRYSPSWRGVGAGRRGCEWAGTCTAPARQGLRIKYGTDTRPIRNPYETDDATQNATVQNPSWNDRSGFRSRPFGIDLVGRASMSVGRRRLCRVDYGTRPPPSSPRSQSLLGGSGPDGGLVCGCERSSGIRPSRPSVCAHDGVLLGCSRSSQDCRSATSGGQEGDH